MVRFHIEVAPKGGRAALRRQSLFGSCLNGAPRGQAFSSRPARNRSAAPSPGRGDIRPTAGALRPLSLERAIVSVLGEGISAPVGELAENVVRSVSEEAAVADLQPPGVVDAAPLIAGGQSMVVGHRA